MKPGPAHLAIGVFLLLGGCGTGEETGRSGEAESASGTPGLFETHTDTVDAVEGPRVSTDRESVDFTGTGFAVQIGAFRNPLNASTAQNAARTRLGVSVSNEYDAASALYLIRAGFFRSREEAVRFRSSILRRFPRDYHDSWIVEVKRTP